MPLLCFAVYRQIGKDNYNTFGTGVRVGFRQGVGARVRGLRLLVYGFTFKFLASGLWF